MGKKSGNSWLNAVKKAFRSPTNENEKRSSRRREEEDDPEGEEEDKKRGKKRWIFRRHSSVETTIQHNVANSSAVRIRSGEENLVRKQPKTETSDAEQRRAFAEAVARTAEAEAAVATAVEIIRQTRPALLLRQEKAALVIQKNFRGYLARRALMALRGVVKLQAIIRGHNVRKRAKLTLECIQSLVRVQSLVCDQRRRLSLDIFTTPIHKNSSREVEEIHALIQKAKECSLKQGKTLAHALSQQISGKEDDDISNRSYPWMRKDRSLCSVEVVDGVSSRPPSFHGRNLNLSPRTPSSSSKIRSIPCSPCYQRGEGRKYEDGETPTRRRRMSMSENSRPNYMAATASAMARVSTPRQRLSSSPCKETTGSGSGSARKRLSFPAYDGYESNLERCGGGVRSDMPYYGTD